MKLNVKASGLVAPLLVGVGIFSFNSGVTTAQENATEPPAVSTFDQLADRQDALLAKVVTDTGLVHYDLLGEADLRAELQALVNEYAHTPIPKWSPAPDTGEDRNNTDDSAADAKQGQFHTHLAFLLNAYNLNVLEQVLVAEVPTRVLDVPGFFDAREITVGGMVMTLNDLENKHVRPLGDPRIHAALNCAALSCPPIARQAFRAATVDSQLDELCKNWVNDETRNYLDTRTGTLMVSQIFEWFADDFAIEPYSGRIGFLKRYASQEGALGRALAKYSSNEAPGPGVGGGVGFVEYDWALNAAPVVGTISDDDH